jgi:hypothetical protein
MRLTAAAAWPAAMQPSPGGSRLWMRTRRPKAASRRETPARRRALAKTPPLSATVSTPASRASAFEAVEDDGSVRREPQRGAVGEQLGAGLEARALGRRLQDAAPLQPARAGDAAFARAEVLPVRRGAFADPLHGVARVHDHGSAAGNRVAHLFPGDEHAAVRGRDRQRSGYRGLSRRGDGLARRPPGGEPAVKHADVRTAQRPGEDVSAAASPQPALHGLLNEHGAARAVPPRPAEDAREMLRELRLSLRRRFRQEGECVNVHGPWNVSAREVLSLAHVEQHGPLRQEHPLKLFDRNQWIHASLSLFQNLAPAFAAAAGKPGPERRRGKVGDGRSLVDLQPRFREGAPQSGASIRGFALLCSNGFRACITVVWGLMQDSFRE